MTRQTSIQLDETTERRIQYLTQCGYGKQTNVIRTAIAFFYAQELQRRGVGTIEVPTDTGHIVEQEGHQTMTTRFFKYTGPDMLTRGDYGVSIRGGHSATDDPRALAVFDPDFGDFVWSSIDAAIESGEWVEVSRAEHAKL